MMAQDKRLRLTLSLPEKHAASVTQDMRAAFTVSSRPGKTFDAVLSRTSGLLDEQSRYITLEYAIANYQGELQGGDYEQVKTTLQTTGRASGRERVCQYVYISVDGV